MSAERYAVWTDGDQYAVWDTRLGQRQSAKHTNGALMLNIVTQLNIQARVRAEIQATRIQGEEGGRVLSTAEAFRRVGPGVAA